MMFLGQIHTDAELQPRASINQFLVDDYAEALSCEADFPAAIVFYDGSVYWLADGFHRHAAHQAVGRDQMLVEVHQGSRRDAVLYAAGANAAHGQRRTNDDKRRAVLRILHDDEWWTWSDREIAKICHVSHDTVARLRRSVREQNSEVDEGPSGRIGQMRKVQRNGKSYGMNTTRIGTAKVTKAARDLLRETCHRDDPEVLEKISKVPDVEQATVAALMTQGTARTVAQAVRQLRRDAKADALAAKEASTIPVSGDSWEVRNGDCVAEMDEMPSESVRLIFADPPYNIGLDYGDGAAGDRRPDDDYMDFCLQWMSQCVRLLTPDGSVWVVINDEYAAEYVMTLKRKLGLHHRRWVKWYETFGVNCSHNFNRTSRHLLYFTRSPDQFVFHPHVFERPSARRVLYNDGRAAPGGKLWDDVWAIPRLVENSAERLPNFPTQLPLMLVTPVIAGCSEPGDLVLDPFAGSCTTGAACIQSGRRFRGIERNSVFAEAGRKRLAAAAHEASMTSRLESSARSR